MFGSGKLARYTNEIFVRKLIFAGTSIGIIIVCSLLCFYFQLGLQKGLGNLISYIGFAIIVLITVLAVKAKKRDNYNMMLLATYSASNDLGGFKNTKDAVSYVESFTNEKLGGYTGYKQALKENAEVLGCALTNFEAFQDFKNKGPLTLLFKVFAKPALGAFKTFAIMDMILSDGPNNKYYRLLALTRWYPQYNRYSKNPLIWAVMVAVPWLAWLILSGIIQSAVQSGSDLAAGGLFLIRWGLFCITLQLTDFLGNQSTVEKIAHDITGDENTQPVIEPASEEWCKWFCSISPTYAKLVVDAQILTEEALHAEAAPQEEAQSEQEIDPFNEFADFE